MAIAPTPAAGLFPAGDPRAILDREPMRGFQVLAVAICFLLNALDGFDVLAITFAAPGIAEDWGINPASIGIVMSVGLVGMVIGSLTLGPLADRIGRRKQILLSLCIMGAGMLASALATSVEMLAALRVFTGLGLGAMIASISAMSAEYANRRRRDLSVAIMAAGYPAGGVVGGWIAAQLLGAYGWESVFLFGGLVTFVMIPLVLFLLPESIGWLARSGAPDALDRINAILKRMGHQAATMIAPRVEGEAVGVAALFSPAMRVTTIALIAMYSLHMMTFYYALNWLPSLVAGMGYDKPTATLVSVVMNLGGVTGGFVLGWLTAPFGLKRVLVVGLFGASIAIALFGQVPTDLTVIRISAFVLGFMSNGTVTVLYALFARAFPTALRAGGTGMVIGVGRFGAASGPLFAGYLLNAGFGRDVTSILLAVGSTLAAAILLTVTIRGAREGEAAE